MKWPDLICIPFLLAKALFISSFIEKDALQQSIFDNT